LYSENIFLRASELFEQNVFEQMYHPQYNS
jgi:hypothetical protein